MGRKSTHSSSCLIPSRAHLLYCSVYLVIARLLFLLLWFLRQSYAQKFLFFASFQPSSNPSLLLFYFDLSQHVTLPETPLCESQG